MIAAPVWVEGNSDGYEDDRRVHVGKAHLSIVPDAGLIDLFDSLDAVDQIVANFGALAVLEASPAISDYRPRRSRRGRFCSPLGTLSAVRGHFDTDTPHTPGPRAEIAFKVAPDGEL